MGDVRATVGGGAWAGPKHELVFIDRLLVTLVRLRTGLTYEALGVLYKVGSSTIDRAIREVRPLPADRGFAVPNRPAIQLRTLEDVSPVPRSTTATAAWPASPSTRSAPRQGN